jgi:hypothetical protein
MAAEGIRFVGDLLFGVGLAFVVFQGLKTGRLKNLWRGWTTSNETPFAFYLTIVVWTAMAAFLLYGAVRKGYSLLHE